MGKHDGWYKVTCGEIGGQKRRVSYAVQVGSNKAAEGAAERRARSEFGGKWMALFVSGPSASPPKA